jgi:O-antigen/teichoic acid export membrane protein
MARHRRRFARNASSAYAVRGLLILSVLLLTPYLFRELGPAGFGAWSVMFTVATSFSLLEVGFSASIVKFVAELRGSGREGEAGSVVRSGVVALAALGVVALVASLAIGFLGDGLAAAGDRDGFRDGLVVLGLAMLVRFPCVAFGAGLAGWQRYDLFNAAEAVVIVGFAAGAVVALETGGGLLGLAIAQAGALVAGGLLFVVLLRRVAPDLRLLPRAQDGPRVAAFGGWTLLADGMTFVAERMDTLVIAAIRGPVAAGAYAAAQKVRSGLQSLTLPLFGLLLPMVAELEAEGRRDEVARRLVLATRVAIQVSLPVACALALFATDAVAVWLGDEAPGSTATLIALLMAVEVLALAATPAHQVLVGVGRVRFVGVFGVADGVANLTLSIALVAVYGAPGAALGTLLTSSLMGLAKIPIAARAIDCPAARLAAEAVRPALLASLPAVALMVAVRLSLEPGAGRLLVGAGIGIAAAAAVALRQLGGPGRLKVALA